MLTVVIPVYNEASNFPALWAAIRENIRSPLQAFAIYDFDQDDTLPVIRQIMAADGGPPLRAVRNRYGRGVVGAIRTGFEQVEHGPILVVMADLSDDLAQVDGMLQLHSQGYHVVVGSRYMKGGKLVGGPFLKQGLSRIAGMSLHWLRGFPTHDATNAFKIYDRDMLRSFTIESKAGFELNLELTVKAFLAGYRIVEIPAVWRDRTRGQSRFRVWRWLPHYLKWYFYAFRPRRTA